MKKFLFTLFALMGTYSLTFAQNFWDASPSKFEFGANVGYNGSYVTENLNGTATIGGFNLGLSADYSFSEKWSIKAKVIYDQKGWGNGIMSFQDGTTFYGVNYKLNYITVPLLASWHFGRTSNWYLNFGPYVGVLMSAKASAGISDVKSAFSHTDGGLAAGIGVKFPVNDNFQIFFETDGQSGVVNIFKNTDGNLYQNVRSSINVGVNFSL
ncbi:MAG: porin family protein [Mucilaginibacter sp.]